MRRLLCSHPRSSFFRVFRLTSLLTLLPALLPFFAVSPESSGERRSSVTLRLGALESIGRSSSSFKGHRVPPAPSYLLRCDRCDCHTFMHTFLSLVLRLSQLANKRLSRVWIPRGSARHGQLMRATTVDDVCTKGN